MTIMHEVGHIRLLHKKEDAENEAEANFFACYFYVPPVLVDYFLLKVLLRLHRSFGFLWRQQSIHGLVM